MTGRRAGVIASFVLIGAATLGACQSDSDPSPAPTESAGTARSIGPLISAYCEIQGLRQLIADGDVKRSDLPDFVDTKEVDGTPLIVDFTRKPDGLDRFRDRLFASPGLKDATVDRDDQRTCVRTTTDADIEKSQGGPGYLADQ